MRTQDLKVSHHKPPAESPVLSGTETQDHLLKLMLAVQLELKRANRQLYDHSNPVDEFEIIGAGAQGGITTIKNDYDSPVIYESILYVLPAGTTSAILQIGSNRSIPLYIGTAITVQQPVILPHLCIEAVGDDRRTLIVVGATNNGYIGLMGHAFARELDK